MEISIVKLICIVILSALIGGTIVFAICYFILERMQKAHEKQIRELTEKANAEYQELNNSWAQRCEWINELWAGHDNKDLYAKRDNGDSGRNDN